jgi:hypothetical protein
MLRTAFSALLDSEPHFNYFKENPDHDPHPE